MGQDRMPEFEPGGGAALNMAGLSDNLPVVAGGQLKHQYSGILIKKNGFLGPTYYLNLRPGNEKDRVYQNRVGLFAGKRKVEEQEEWETAAVRELNQETGLIIGERELDPIMVVQSFDNANNTNSGQIFLKTFGFWERAPDRKKIKRYIAAERRKGNDIGKLRVVKRWFWTFYTWNFFLPLNWARFTPEAIYALISDYDLDISNRPWRKRHHKT